MYLNISESYSSSHHLSSKVLLLLAVWGLLFFHIYFKTDMPIGLMIPVVIIDHSFH